MSGLQGRPDAPIVIEGADASQPPVFQGGACAWHLAGCAWLTLRNLSVKGQTGNGLNIDDGGRIDSPSQHIVLDNIRVEDVGPVGNCDGIKLSGVEDFVVRRCRCTGWGGQALDMVGCHRGLVEDCEFVGKAGYSQATGPQTKGGSSQITIRACRFEDAGTRAVNLGGSTGRAYFRPAGATYEAQNIVVEGCTFVGCEAPICFVGVDGARVRYNTIYHPRTWILRILQETREAEFVKCRGGRFERNLVVYRSSDLRTWVNVGSDTPPDTFSFANNFWYCEDRPERSQPTLPVAETGGVHTPDPQLTPLESGQFQPRDPLAARYGATAWPGAVPE